MQRDLHDLWGGAVLALLGLAVAVHSAISYDFGTLRQMGPGFFPTLLGATLAVLGMIVAVPAWRRQGQAAPVALPEAAAVLGSIVLFGLTLDWLGLVAATALTAVIATLPSERRGWRWRVVLAGALALLVWLVFSVGLQMTIPVWPWSR